MYPGVDPTDSIVQEAIMGESAESVGRQMHDDALNGRLKQAVKEVFDEFGVTASWDQKEELQFVIECPSGQKCLARHLNTLDLIETDLLDEIDYFSKKLFAESKEDESESKESSFSVILKDPERRMRLFNLLDGLLNIGVIKPKIHRIPQDIEASKYRSWVGPPLPKGEVWANKVDFSDKMHIFGELNKPLDEIKTFRLEKPSVENLEAMENISGETK